MRCCSAISVLLILAAPLAAAEPKQITHDGQRKLAPRFLAGGESVIYSAYTIPNRVTLLKLKLAGGQPVPVFPDGTAHQFDPVVSADGRYVVYCRSMGSPQIALVIKDTEENSESVFTPEGARSTARGPQLLPDNSRVFFTISAPGGQQIASVNLDGQDFQKLTESEGINCWPAVSADGRRIAFCSSREGNLELYTMRSDGSEVRRLTATPQREMRPSWSPDSKRIAFVTVRDGNHEVYVADADGRNVVRITQHPEIDDWPIWHPDGRQLLTVSQRGGKFDLYVWPLPGAE